MIVYSCHSKPRFTARSLHDGGVTFSLVCNRVSKTTFAPAVKRGVSGMVEVTVDQHARGNLEGMHL